MNKTTFICANCGCETTFESGCYTNPKTGGKWCDACYQSLPNRESVTNSVCERCGGSTVKLLTLGRNHRNLAYCVAELKRQQGLHRTTDQIRSEIAALEKTAKDYDTVRQSNDTCVAAGAHDALRWALGLADQSVSETIAR